MSLPFTTRRNGDGIVWIERAKDEAFRKALLDGVPPSLRSKMHEALAQIPDKGSYAHSVRYFGDELPGIMERTGPLLIQLNKFLADRYQLPGLFDWLTVTGFSNDYRMIKVFKAWSEMTVKQNA